MSNASERAIERVARESYGRLLAYLVSRTHDVASAEDALGDAMIRALGSWPRDGVPGNPEAWLITTARHALIDRVRRQRVALAAEATLSRFQEVSAQPELQPGFPDERLKLLFVCAHPAIDPAMHTPLMLQTVLGLDAARIASAFLIAPKTMGQRLVRAKTKIQSGGLKFEIPEERHLPARLQAVLEAIYAAFGIAWDEVGVDDSSRDLTDEALWLARVLLQLLPQEAEVYGLLALMLHCEARRPARRGPSGEYVLLSRQDPARWSRALIDEAEQLLVKAAGFECPGRFQLEAAIQSVHAERVRGRETDWNAIACFYEHLVRLSPGVGARTGYAAAIANCKGPEAGLAVLDEIASVAGLQALSVYQPFWAVRAHLLHAAGEGIQAREAYDTAIGLSRDPAVREFLVRAQAKIPFPAV
jgi:RNA polymerase sigma-70 factor (ECF subfamily)